MNAYWSLEENKELLEEIPLQRMALLEEIASLLLCLLSENSAYITGTTIPVTG